MLRFKLLSSPEMSLKLMASAMSVSFGRREIGAKRCGNLPISFVS